MDKFQRELFLLEVNNRDNNRAIEVNNHTYGLQKRIEKFPLIAGIDCRKYVNSRMACLTVFTQIFLQFLKQSIVVIVDKEN